MKQQKQSIILVHYATNDSPLPNQNKKTNKRFKADKKKFTRQNTINLKIDFSSIHTITKFKIFTLIKTIAI